MPLYLSEWLNHKGINNVALAAQLGINHSTIHRWRKGERPIRTDDLERLATALGIEPATLWRKPPKGESIAEIMKQKDGPAKKFALIKFFGAMLREHGYKPKEMSCAELVLAIESLNDNATQPSLSSK